jgi:hypothetical protein
MMAALDRPLGRPIPLAQLLGAQMRHQFDPLTHDPPDVAAQSQVNHKTCESIKRFWLSNSGLSVKHSRTLCPSPGTRLSPKS